LVFAGDFLQLPPIDDKVRRALRHRLLALTQSKRSGSTPATPAPAAKYAFQADSWRAAFSGREVLLSAPHRQTEEQFVIMLNEVSAFACVAVCV
jgi:hypothetical protein